MGQPFIALVLNQQNTQSHWVYKEREFVCLIIDINESQLIEDSENILRYATSMYVQIEYIIRSDL